MQRLRASFVPARVSRSARSTAARAPGTSRVRSPSTCTATPCPHAALAPHDLRLFGLGRPLHPLRMVVVHLLAVLLGVLLFVVGDVLGLLDTVDRLGARVAPRDPPFFGELVDDLDELAAALLGERRGRKPDHVAGTRPGGTNPVRDAALLARLEGRRVPPLPPRARP